MFTHKNDDLIFGAISITERRCAAPIFNERGVTYRGCSHYIEDSFRADTKGYPLGEHNLNIEYFKESAYVDYVR